MGSALPWIFGFGTIAVSAVPILAVLRLRYANRFQSVIILAFAGILSILCILVGVWCYTSFYLKFLFAGIMIWALLTSILKRKTRKSVVPKKNGPSVPVMAVLSPVLFILTVLVLKGCSYSEKPIELEFPMTSGRYFVLQGGNSAVTNPFHHSHIKTQRYAYDFVKLNIFGNRAHGISPRNLESYACFKENLYCPFAGKVVKSEDGHADNPIGTWDFQNPAGNFVAVIDKDSVVVLLCHMKKGSVAVTTGEDVALGQFLGLVGNSGHSSEPYLHIAAFRRDTPVPIRFDGRFLTINNIVIRDF